MHPSIPHRISRKLASRYQSGKYFVVVQDIDPDKMICKAIVKEHTRVGPPVVHTEFRIWFDASGYITASNPALPEKA